MPVGRQVEKQRNSCSDEPHGEKVGKKKEAVFKDRVAEDGKDPAMPSHEGDQRFSVRGGKGEGEISAFYLGEVVEENRPLSRAFGPTAQRKKGEK